jgi:hypothetical protein
MAERHLIAAGTPMQSAPYRDDGDRLVCDLTFCDQNLQNVKITLPFFIGLAPGDEVVAEQWPEVMRKIA